MESSGNKGPKRPKIINEERLEWNARYQQELDANFAASSKAPKAQTASDAYERKAESSDKKKENAMVDFINRWQKDNSLESQLTMEQLPQKQVEVINSSKILEASRHLFLSYLLRRVRDQMNESSYKKDNDVLNKLSDVYRIEIKSIEGTDRLQFDVYANIKAVLRRHPQLFVFKLDSNGQITLT
jgi:hypothetical protein